MLAHHSRCRRLLRRRTGEVDGLGAQAVGGAASRCRCAHRYRFSPTPSHECARPDGVRTVANGADQRAASTSAPDRARAHLRHPFCGMPERRAAENNRRWRATHATFSSARGPHRRDGSRLTDIEPWQLRRPFHSPLTPLFPAPDGRKTPRMNRPRDAPGGLAVGLVGLAVLPEKSAPLPAVLPLPLPPPSPFLLPPAHPTRPHTRGNRARYAFSGALWRGGKREVAPRRHRNRRGRGEQPERHRHPERPAWRTEPGERVRTRGRSRPAPPVDRHRPGHPQGDPRARGRASPGSANSSNCTR